jgi:hypothetical protein
MGADASPLARFRRAVERRSLVQAEAAARELGRLGSADALALTLLLLEKRDARFERSATRWLGRLLADRPNIGLEIASELASSLAGIAGAYADVSRSRAALLLRSADCPETAEILERWDRGGA